MEMTDRMYDRLANFLMLVAVGSALLFDSGKLSHGVVATIGGAAAAGAIGLYFSNQSRASTKPGALVKEALQKVAANAAVGQKEATVKMTRAEPSFGVGEGKSHVIVHMAKSDAARKNYQLAHYFMQDMKYGVAGVPVVWTHAIPFVTTKQKEVADAQPSPIDVAACAAEIIRTLSAGEGHDRWEFNFGPDGLRVSAKKGNLQRPKNPQEDFDFGRIATPVN
jgi:hypothetical protein